MSQLLHEPDFVFPRSSQFSRRFHPAASLAKYDPRAALSDAVGAFIAWLVNESGYGRRGRRRGPDSTASPGDLFRRFRNFGADVTRAYVRALESRRIPHVLVGGRSFHDREEIISLRNALTAIEWPDDELKVFATLRGPFFAIGDEALLVFRQQAGDNGDLKTRRLNPMHKTDRATLNPSAIEAADALDVLRLLPGHNSRTLEAFSNKQVPERVDLNAFVAGCAHLALLI